jgi:hypothetical protein
MSLKHDKIYEFCPTWALQPGILIKRNDFCIFPIIWGGLKIIKRVNFEAC